MQPSFINLISQELNITPKQVEAVLGLLEEGNTIPFIARYRKEKTGNLDETIILEIKDKHKKYLDLDQRRSSILSSLEERNLLTKELKEKLLACSKLSELEDLYLPYKPKRRTRATIAKEKGLEPLSDWILSNQKMDALPYAKAFVNPDKGVNTLEEAIEGAKDILAEKFSEDLVARKSLRVLYEKEGSVGSKRVKEEKEGIEKYTDYFEYNESVEKIPSHRILALFRGEKEGFLKLDIAPNEEKALSILNSLFVKGNGVGAKIVKESIESSYKRLLSPSLETEIRQLLRERAEDKAIQVFSQNLKKLLLASPLGNKRILAIDPGFRTGCKIVCLGISGELLYNDTIYPHPPNERQEQSEATIKKLCSQFSIEVIAIGNGTAGRETEAFIQKIKMEKKPPVIVVNESGASVYSASEVAREEFPNHDVTVRGAVSIGRRLMDPLAELVKIEPKSIGVGQYQHDVNQTHLDEKLKEVVESCVNNVGVNLNTASKELLTYISGLGEVLAGNIIKYRQEKGKFISRKDLLKVPRLGPKAFEQAAGFLRIPDGKEALDSSAVHPESYPIVEKMASSLNCTIKELLFNEKLVKKIDVKQFVTKEAGLPTLNDIIQELLKPGRDPREKFEFFSFKEGVNTIEDLKENMVLPGIVTNVTAFGVFVDIGVHQDGLVHISELADKFVKDPLEVVQVQDKVTVRVLSVDKKRKRISLSMKKRG